MRLLLDSDIDASIRLLPAVRDSPTPSTPPVPPPAAPHANDSDGIKSARLLFEDNVAKVAAVYAKGRHRQWAKAVRELSLGGKDQYFEAGKDSEKLSKIVVVLKNEFNSAGLELSSFDLDDLTKAVIPRVNELLCDTLACIVKTDSAAEHFLLDTDSVSDRDGRRALLELIKGRVPPGVRQTLQEEHSQLRYPARVDPRPLLAKEQRLVRDNRSEDWTPTESTRKYKLSGEKSSSDASWPNIANHLRSAIGRIGHHVELFRPAFGHKFYMGGLRAP
ncbi:hypothetical protein CYMTET_12934 [Cymbomonas tetramitiformis]|uniref:Uncharacterized protein n=1 Tax=Cymbomonas tetramitiformis TaxID=36881 RepID=A0AAE0GKQ1_9CHLO|nr:hypothetical protein CYMTET_12934 [Cymbomonas tetramitiformis]